MFFSVPQNKKLTLGMREVCAYATFCQFMVTSWKLDFNS